MLKKKKIIFAVVLSALLIVAGVSLCAGVANENNSGELTMQTKQVFSDVKETDWFYSDVGYANERGLMQGTSDTLFAPDSPTTRGMLVTILWRLDGEPIESGNAFSDVANDTYYYDAVSWASKFGIANGYTERVFSPEDNITREQLASILYRYAEYKQYDTTPKSELSEYTDKKQISDYAVSAMQWTNANGIITGTTEDTLSPQGNALRCQIAAILNRFCNQFKVQQPVDESKEVTQSEANKNNGQSNIGSDSKQPSSEGMSSGSSSESGEIIGGNYPIITVNSVSAKPGEIVEVNIDVSNNPGILGMTLTAYFDENTLTLQSVKNGEAFKDVLDITPSNTLKSGSRFMWDGIEVKGEDIRNGTILTMKFTVNPDSASGRYPITLKYADGDIVDNNLVPIVATIEDGYITIE